MHILKHGRSAFLEFLRNLTPQVLLATLLVLAFSTSYALCESRDWGYSIIAALAGVALLVVLGASALANASHFIIAYQTSHPDNAALKGKEFGRIQDLEKEAEAAGVKFSAVTMYSLLLLAQLLFFCAIALAAFNLGMLRLPL